MPDRTVNERIAVLLGWKLPGSPEHTELWRGRYRHLTEYEAGECGVNPEGDLAPLPLFDTDPAASMELLDHCEDWEMSKKDDGIWAYVIVDGLPGAAIRPRLAEAIAAAFLEACGG